MAPMEREFNGNPLELLAPAGTFDIYKAIIDSSCDAVYCGGQSLNMRMIRKGYNLSNDELKAAVDLANERNKKVYITVNSLLEQSELTQAEEYLDFLEEIRPHGLIIQDAAILDLVKKKGISLPLHGSVMMNVHNLSMIRFLERQGVTRVVLSREMPLREVRSLSLQTRMELEYFTHGDMCVTHGSQCYYSSYLFGMSSNRGRCLKPCRWGFSRPGSPGDKPFPLAVKDLNLYSHLSDMILAGICSFKIEGRMRSREFILDLVNCYGRALDRFLDDPVGALYANPEDMEPFKKRDYSTAYAFGKPGLANINSRGEGSGKFYSTGKMFSVPAEEKEIGPAETEADPHPLSSSTRLGMSVRVNSPDQARLALSCGADRIYLSTEPFAPDAPAGLDELEDLSRVCRGTGCELFLSLPRMMSDTRFNLFREYLKKDIPIKGILAGFSGAFELAAKRDLAVICDTPMNLYNARAVAFYLDEGASGWTPSLEMPMASLLSLPGALKELGCTVPGEVVLHGQPTMMYMDHDISNEREDRVELTTPESSLTVRRDCWNRYHLLPHKEYSLLPRLEELAGAGYEMFRVELQAYETEAAENVLNVCRESLNDPVHAKTLFSNLKSVGGGFTYGAQQF